MSQPNSTPEQLAKAREYQRVYRLKYPEKVKANQRASYRRHAAKRIKNAKEWSERNPEKRKQYSLNFRVKYKETLPQYKAAKRAEWRKQHPLESKAEIAEWRLKNKDKIRQHQVDYREKNRVELAMAQRIRGIRTRTKIKKEEISNWESRICGICNLLIEDKFHVDHKIPLAKGGFHVAENLQLTHPSCNLRKGDKLLTQLT